jgi:hypothetical protein
MLLLSGINREDGQLVELGAVHERWPGTNTSALVLTSVHTNPGVLGMHLVDNLVSLSLRITKDKTTEHFISLLGFSGRDTLLGLDDFFVFGKQLLPNFLLSFCLIFGELKKRLHFPSNFNQSMKGLLYVCCHSFLIDDA